MIKPLIILFNTVTVFIFSFFFGDTPVTLTGTFPKNMKPNVDAVAEIKINKGSVGGFAKLQLEVPQGLVVKELESKGGNFSYSGNIAKIIWTAIPSDAEFTVKFTMTSDATVTGVKALNSKFSYVTNNNKEVVEMTPVEITFGDEPVATNTAPEVKTPDSNPVATETTNNTQPTNTSTPPANTQFNNNAEPNSDVVCKRTITAGSNSNEINVEVNIKKGSVKGFAKYQEVIPAGFSVKAGKTNGSSFSFSDGKAKFVWVALPADEELTVSYVLEKGSSASADAKLDNGEFSYLESDKTKKIKMPSEAIITTSAPVVTETTQPVNTNTLAAVETNTVTPVSTETKPVQTETPVNNEVATNANQQNESNTAAKTTEPVNAGNVAKKEGNVQYAVQVGAFKNAIQADVLSKKFNITESIKSEMAEGYSKFMVGSFAEYKQARNHREDIKQKGCKSAFVVAYNGAKRITVQEALMITNQKWFK